MVRRRLLTQSRLNLTDDGIVVFSTKAIGPLFDADDTALLGYFALLAVASINEVPWEPSRHGPSLPIFRTHFSRLSTNTTAIGLSPRPCEALVFCRSTESSPHQPHRLGLSARPSPSSPASPSQGANCRAELPPLARLRTPTPFDPAPFSSQTIITTLLKLRLDHINIPSSYVPPP